MFPSKIAEKALEKPALIADLTNGVAHARLLAQKHHDAVGLGKMNEIPDDEEIIHVSHAVNDIQLVVQPLLKAPVVLRVAFGKTVLAELI